MDIKKACIVCNNHCNDLFLKGVIKYYQCTSCKTVFCGALDNDGLVGGEYEYERNEKENYLRIDRVNQVTSGINKDDVFILDFGCGHGLFIEDLKKNGYVNVHGFDAYYEPYMQLPKKNLYHVVTMTECIEHTTYPFPEINVIHRSMVDNGILIIETSFVNIAEEEKIPLDSFFYINPQAGHSTVFSHHGLDVLLLTKGFMPMQHFNRHVRVYKKISK